LDYAYYFSFTAYHLVLVLHVKNKSSMKIQMKIISSLLHIWRTNHQAFNSISSISKTKKNNHVNIISV